MVTGNETAIVRTNGGVNGGGDLATPRSRALMPAMTIDQAIDRYNLVLEFTKKAFKPDIDFGIIPGTGKKPTLLKPGAEKLCSLFGLVPDFEEMRIVEDWKDGLFYYCYKATLNNVDGVRLGSGIGSCNSREKKYRWRNAQVVCPNCGKSTIIRSKFPSRETPHLPNPWVCLTKSGGCGREFDHDDQAITAQSTGRVANDEPFELINTLQKMAQKRALIAAILVVTNASEFFTQDLEDQNYIDTDWTPAATTDGRRETLPTDPPDDVDDATNYKTRGGEPDISHDPTFLECWRRTARERKIDGDKAVRWLEFALSKSPKGSPKKVRTLRPADRANHLAALADGKYDVLIVGEKPDPAKPPATKTAARAAAAPADAGPASTPPADAHTIQKKRDGWSDFLSTMKMRAKELQVADAKVLDVVAARALALGIKGREYEMAAIDRQAIYDDLDRLQGPFETDDVTY